MWGVAGSEAIAHDGRIHTFEAHKRGMERMFEREQGYGGLVRAKKHDVGEEVGRAFTWQPDEDTREVIVGCRISLGAEDAWQKVLDGTYRGFSVGGKILEVERRVMRVGDGQRSVPVVTDVDYDEVVLTGQPSDPKARFTAVHRTADGSIELDDAIDEGGIELPDQYVGRATLTAADRDALSDSDFAFIDDSGRHLPIHDEAHIRAALGGNGFSAQQGIPKEQRAKVAKKITSAAEKAGIEVDPESEVGTAAGLKGGAAVARTDEPDLSEREMKEEVARAVGMDDAALKLLGLDDVRKLYDNLVKGHRNPSEDVEAAAVARTDPDPAPGDGGGGEGGEDPAAVAAAAAEKVARDMAEVAAAAADALAGGGEDDAGAGDEADEMDSAKLGMAAIKLIDKLIAMESSELAEDGGDADDVQSLLYTRDCLRHFVKHEIMEGMEMGRAIEELRATTARLEKDFAHSLSEVTKLAGQAVARAAELATEHEETVERVEKLVADAEEIARAGNPFKDELDELVARVQTIEDTPLPGLATRQAPPAGTALEKILAADGPHDKTTVDESLKVLRARFPGSGDVLDRLEAEALIRSGMPSSTPVRPGSGSHI